MQAMGAVAAAVLAGILAWTPYVRTTPEYDHVVETLGGRPTETATTDPDELEAALVGRTVLLIPEQQETDEETLEVLGSAVSPVLTRFLAQGGRIVGMSYSRGAEDVLRGAGLWNVNDGYDVTGADLAVALSGHPLAAGVPVTFVGTDGSTDFYGLPDGAVVLVWDTFDEAPVAFTWETGGGTVVMLGFDFFESSPPTAQLLRNALGVASAGGDGTGAAAGEIVRALDATALEEMLIDLGLTFDRRTDAHGDPLWVIYWDEVTVVLLVDDPLPADSKVYQTLLLYAVWRLEAKASCDVVNEWNRSARGTRAYLDSDGDPVLQAELHLAGGVTPATVVQFLKRFERSGSEFGRYLGR